MAAPKITKLTGPQFEKWLNAFFAAFDMDSLREMLRTKLGERLDTISKDGNLRVVVHELLDWGERTGNLNRLLDGSAAAVPGNAALLALVAGAQVVAEPDAAKPEVQLSAPGPHHVFLDYSRKDSEFMQRLRADLNAAEIVCWIDEDDLEPGTLVWQRAIQQAIRATECMVAILSPDAAQSEWVMAEISSATLNSRRIFPVLAKGEIVDAVPLSLLNAHHVDARTDYASGVQGKLIPAVKKHLGMATATPAKPVVNVTPEPVDNAPAAKPPADTTPQTLEKVVRQPEKPVKAPQIVVAKSTFEPTDIAAQLGIEWITIPAGEFLMGSDRKKDEQAFDDETPQYKVNLPAFRCSN